MGTFAYGDVAAGLALCIHTALVLARINALIIAAGTVIWAVLVRLTLALCAFKESDTVSGVQWLFVAKDGEKKERDSFN